MKNVYILNENVYPLRELFKGEEVNILAGDFWRDKKGGKKVLDLYEANDFRGQYHPTPIDLSGKMTNDPRGFKMIKMIPVEGSNENVVMSTEVFKCMAKDCKHTSPTADSLDAHIRTWHPTAEKLVLPDVDAVVSRKAK